MTPPKKSKFETLRYVFYDTVPVGLGCALDSPWRMFDAFGANAGQRDKTNIRVPEQFVEGMYTIHAVAVGAPTLAVLKTWATAVLTVLVGLKPLFAAPLWVPPDAGIPDRGQVLETPVGWTFYGWDLVPIRVHPRQRSVVRVELPGTETPAGDLRVVVDGYMTREWG